MKTQIFVTIGPVTDNLVSMKNLAQAGASVFRLNMSHGNQKSHESTLKKLKQLQKEYPIQILLDTKGPEIRTGEFTGSLTLNKGDILQISPHTNDVSQKIISTDYKKLHTILKPEQKILLDGGKITLIVQHIIGDIIHTMVTNSGVISSLRHVNIPDVTLDLPILTESDKNIFRMAAPYKPDYIAASFIRNTHDIDSIRSYLLDIAPYTKIISKIEHAEAMKNINSIIPASDEIMIARGDLGVETDWYKVPVKEERLIRLSLKHNKPVTVATEMLSSMQYSQTPTRAEVMDVSIAVQMGATSVMLSDETTIGEFPIHAVKVMKTIAEYAEQHRL
jgi:pyruvate kinase